MNRMIRTINFSGVDCIAMIILHIVVRGFKIASRNHLSFAYRKSPRCSTPWLLAVPQTTLY